MELQIVWKEVWQSCGGFKIVLGCKCLQGATKGSHGTEWLRIIQEIQYPLASNNAHRGKQSSTMHIQWDALI